MQEIICRFSKAEEVKWVSHLETMRMLERALRRAQIPIAYTQGFNPRPRLAMGPALAAGMTSEAELAAFFLSRKTDPEALKEKMNDQLPAGFAVQTAWAIPGYRKKQTLGDIDTAEYKVTVKGPVGAEELQRRVVGLLACEEIPLVRKREKKTQEIDLRPLILELSVSEINGGAEIKMTLRTGSTGGARPQEVLEQLGVTGGEWSVVYHRKALYAGQTEKRSKPRGVRLRSLHRNQADLRGKRKGRGGR